VGPKKTAIANRHFKQFVNLHALQFLSPWIGIIEDTIIVTVLQVVQRHVNVHSVCGFAKIFIGSKLN
jgi:hypothetical protein